VYQKIAHSILYAVFAIPYMLFISAALFYIVSFIMAGPLTIPIIMYKEEGYPFWLTLFFYNYYGITGISVMIWADDADIDINVDLLMGVAIAEMLIFMFTAYIAGW